MLDNFFVKLLFWGLIGYWLVVFESVYVVKIERFNKCFGFLIFIYFELVKKCLICERMVGKMIMVNIISSGKVFL